MAGNVVMETYRKLAIMDMGDKGIEVMVQTPSRPHLEHTRC